MQHATEWLLHRLACPRHREPLELRGEALICPHDHRFSIVDGIPVLLSADLPATHPYRDASLAKAASNAPLDTAHAPQTDVAVDPFVQDEIVRTNGNLYRHLRGRLPRYPIPTLRLPRGDGRTFLDVGCNWGRWTFAAARAGYRAIGLDPWIDAARAGRRVARKLGLDVGFVVGDGRQLPFAEGTFDVSYSYSVLQHFDKADARAALAEISRVTARDGKLVVQMPNVFGLRQAYNVLRQRLRRDTNPFRVRYWRPLELRRTFERIIGPTTLSADGYFSLNPQSSDLDLLPSHYAFVVRLSEALRTASESIPMLRMLADSLFVQSDNTGPLHGTR